MGLLSLQAQSGRKKLRLPLNPSRVFKINYILISTIVENLLLIPFYLKILTSYKATHPPIRFFLFLFLFLLSHLIDKELKKGINIA